MYNVVGELFCGVIKEDVVIVYCDNVVVIGVGGV